MNSQDEQFVRFLREEAGDYLRGVLAYDADDVHVLFLREGLAADADWRETAMEELPTVADHARTEHQVSDLSLFGEFAGTVRVFGNAVLIQFPQRNPEGGYGVSVDPEATPDLVDFVADAANHLRTD